MSRNDNLFNLILCILDLNVHFGSHSVNMQMWPSLYWNLCVRIFINEVVKLIWKKNIAFFGTRYNKSIEFSFTLEVIYKVPIKEPQRKKLYRVRSDKLIFNKFVANEISFIPVLDFFSIIRDAVRHWSWCSIQWMQCVDDDIKKFSILLVAQKTYILLLYIGTFGISTMVLLLL